MKPDTNFVIVSFRRAKNLGRRGNVRGKSFKNTPNHIITCGRPILERGMAMAGETVTVDAEL